MVAPIIYAQSTSEDVLAILTEKREFRLLNVFERACNLLDESDGTVISLLSDSEKASPFSIQIPLDEMKRHFVEGVYRSEYRLLKSPHWLIELEQVTIWNAHLPLETIHKEDLEILIGLSKTALVRAPDSLAQPYLKLPVSQSSVQALYYAEAGATIARFLECLSFGDFAQLKPIVEELTGSGFGLTPSGDDWLLGAMLALQLSGQDQLAREIGLVASQSTTPLSAAYLRMASEGKYGEVWHDFFTASRLNQMQKAIQSILAYGHSSGADALTGFVQSSESLLCNP